MLSNDYMKGLRGATGKEIKRSDFNAENSNQYSAKLYLDSANDLFDISV